MKHKQPVINLKHSEPQNNNKSSIAQNHFSNQTNKKCLGVFHNEIVLYLIIT